MTIESRARSAGQGVRRAVETMETSMKTDERSKVERFDRFRVRKDRNRAIGAVVVALVITAAVLVTVSIGRGSRQPVGQPSLETNIGTMTITKDGCTLAGATDIAAGRFTLTVINKTNSAKGVRAFKTASDAQFAQLLAYVAGVKGPTDASRHFLNGNIQPFMKFGWGTDLGLDAHDSSTISGWFDPGTYGFRCHGDVEGIGGIPDPAYAPGVGWRLSDFVGPIDARSR
jgi:hypothetical protein